MSAKLPTPLSSAKGSYSSSHSGKTSLSRPTSPVLPSSSSSSSSSNSTIGSPTVSPRPAPLRVSTVACSHAHIHAPLSSAMLSPVDHPPLRLLTAASCLESFTTLVSAKSPPHSPTFTAMTAFHGTAGSPISASSAVSAASVSSAPSSRASSIMDGIQTTLLGAGHGATATASVCASTHHPQHSAAKESLSRVHRAHQQHEYLQRQGAWTTSRSGAEVGALGHDHHDNDNDNDESSVSAMPRSRSDYFSFPSFEDVDFVYVAMEQEDGEEEDEDEYENKDEEHDKKKKKGKQDEEDDAHAEESTRVKKRMRGNDEKHGPWKAQNHALQLNHSYHSQQQQQQHHQQHQHLASMGYAEQRRHSDNHLTDRGKYATGTCQPLPNYEQLQQQMQQRRKASYPSMGYYPPLPLDAHHMQYQQQNQQQQRDETHSRHPFKSSMSPNAEKRAMMSPTIPSENWRVQLEPYQELRVDGP
ncbi:hypothetical protein DFQ26_003830 [Actinomortierella ambigua]|nr:hypothetical protein DFQ26_003830 [Actinomortierella ambigua]